MKQDATPPERVHRARGPGDRPATGGDVRTRRPQARRSCWVSWYRKAQKRGLFGNGKNGARIVNLFRDLDSFASVVVHGGTTRKGLK